MAVGLLERPRVPRVVVTGFDDVSPLGSNADSSWENLLKGKTGIKKSKVNSGVHVAAPAVPYEREGVLTKSEHDRSSPAVIMAQYAADGALRRAHLIGDDGQFDPKVDRRRVGVRIGTGFGGAAELVEIARKFDAGERVSINDSLHVLMGRASTVVSMRHGLMGPIETPSAECATGNVAIYEGCLDIMSPLKDSPKIMVVGGTEGLTDQRDVFTVFNTIKALHTGTDPKKASRPFHKERSGFVMGAGAGALILEDLDHALARGAPIYAEVAGFSNASDGNPKGDTLPSLEGIVNAMTIARERAGPIPKKGLIYVNAHGTSTPAGDRVELQALKEVYGDVLDRLRVSSTKGNTGHLLGAAAAVEAIFTIQALNSGKLPRTRGLDDPMESNGVFLIRKRLITGEVVWGINDAFGFGGIDSVVIFKKYKPELN